MTVSVLLQVLLFRWLLLDFKREFTFYDSLRILEVLHSRHLELSSNRALKEVDIAAQEEFAAEGSLVIGHMTVILSHVIVV